MAEYGITLTAVCDHKGCWESLVDYPDEDTENINSGIGWCLHLLPKLPEAQGWTLTKDTTLCPKHSPTPRKKEKR